MAHEKCGVAQELVGRGAPPLRVARRKMLADIAGADCAQQRVGQGVKTDIGVRMADKALVVCDPDAANHHMVARSESVRVETLADPHIARSGR